MTAEKMLWIAVLHLAALDLVGERGEVHGFIRHHRRQAARAWFASDGRDIGDFLWCADVVGIDGPNFRRRLFRLADRKNGYISGQGRAEIVAPGASLREVFGDFTSENEKAGI